MFKCTVKYAAKAIFPGGGGGVEVKLPAALHISYGTLWLIERKAQC